MASRFSFPRFNTANTTVRRVDGPVLARLLTIADSTDLWTTRTHRTWTACKAAIAEHLDVKVDVVSKTLLFGENLGLFQRVDPAAVSDALGDTPAGTADDGDLTLFTATEEPSTGSGASDAPARSTRWLRLCPAGESFLTTNDLPAAVAHQLLRIPMEVPNGSSSRLIRPAVAALQFLSEVPDGWCTTAEYAMFCAAAGREGPWTKAVKELAQHRETGAGDVAALAERIWDHPDNADTRSSVTAAVAEVLDGDRGSVGSRLDTARGRLVPGVKEAAWPVARAALIAAFGHGEEEFAATVRKLLCDRAVETCLDMNKAYLSMLQQAELIEHKGAGAATEWRISPFGEEALAACARPPKSSAEAAAALRNATDFGYAERTRDRRDKLTALIEKLRTGNAPGLLDDLEWERLRGQGEAGRYEWAAVLATLAAVELDEDWDPFDPVDGLRTRLSYDLEPLGPAAGLGGDAYITTRDGLTIIVEVTGVEGDRQISQELEPTTRHLRDRLARDGEAVVLFVAPEVSERFFAHWLGVAAFEDPTRPAMVVPVTEAQLRTVAEAKADLVEICRQVVAATERIANTSLETHRMSWPVHAARELLVEIQRIIDTAVADA